MRQNQQEKEVKNVRKNSRLYSVFSRNAMLRNAMFDPDLGQIPFENEMWVGRILAMKTMLSAKSNEWLLRRQGLRTSIFHVQNHDGICQIPCKWNLLVGRLSVPPMGEWNMSQSAQKVTFLFLGTHCRQRRRKRYTHTLTNSISKRFNFTFTQRLTKRFDTQMLCSDWIAPYFVVCRSRSLSLDLLGLIQIQG